jgi:hypothetical protein
LVSALREGRSDAVKRGFLRVLVSQTVQGGDQQMFGKRWRRKTYA